MLWHASAKKPVFDSNVSVTLKLAGSSSVISLTGDGGGGGEGGNIGTKSAESVLSAFGFSYDDFADLGYPHVDMAAIRPFVSIKRMRELNGQVARDSTHFHALCWPCR